MSEEVKPQSTPAPAPEAPKAPEAAPAPAPEAPAPAAAPVENPGDKSAAPAAPEAPKAPEKYDLKLSEDSLVDAAFLQRIEAHARAQGLTQEQAQALLTSEEEKVAEQVQLQSDAWRKAAESDPEIGGEKLAEHAELARRALDAFPGGKKLQAELERFGYGNHPEVVRYLSQVGRLLADDKYFAHQASSGGKEKSTAQVLYGGADKQ